MVDEVAVTRAPNGGLWRVGRNPDPLLVVPPKAHDLRSKSAGNRFDIPGIGVLYFATRLEGCFAETLARFRPKPSLAALVAEEWAGANVLRPGAVPAGWRHRRTAVRVGIHRGYEFLDVDDLATHQVLTRDLATGLASLGYGGLDIGLVRGPDRRVTRLLAQWVYEQENEDGYGRFAGIRYCSRLSNEWTCWAVFPGVELTLREAVPIEREMKPLATVARRLGLQVF